jgi:CRISPR/Cas system-associated endonuclease Cas1
MSETARHLLVFDLMEPERPKVDRAVLGFLKSEAFHPADFTIREDGVVRLNPELARRVVAIVETFSQRCDSSATNRSCVPGQACNVVAPLR